MRAVRWTGAAVLILSVFLLNAGTRAAGAEFSADTIRVEEGQTHPGKVYVKGKKMRMEFAAKGQSMVTIMDMEKGSSVILFPHDKTYMENPLAAGLARVSPSDPEMTKYGHWKPQGSETVNGYVCEKQVFVYKEKSMGELTQWFSKKLEYPIKTMYKGPRGEMRMESRNIKEGGVADSLFAMPAGYTRVDPFGGGRRGSAPRAGGPASPAEEEEDDEEEPGEDEGEGLEEDPGDEEDWEDEEDGEEDPEDDDPDGDLEDEDDLDEEDEEDLEEEDEEV
jgi:hypothetical protein